MIFERENRYLVLKYSELEQCFNKSDWKLLEELTQKADTFRRVVRQKGVLYGVFVESDWPEYETVWNMIEERTAKENKND